jgi:hypothetical protein
MNPLRSLLNRFTPAWKKTDDYRRWKAGLPSIGEEAMDRAHADRMTHPYTLAYRERI